jgi:hypothetical protein
MRCYSTTVDESVLVGPFRWRTMQANAATANSSSSNSPGLVRAFFFSLAFCVPVQARQGCKEQRGEECVSDRRLSRPEIQFGAGDGCRLVCKKIWGRKREKKAESKSFFFFLGQEVRRRMEGQRPRGRGGKLNQKGTRNTVVNQEGRPPQSSQTAIALGDGYTWVEH